MTKNSTGEPRLCCGGGNCNCKTADNKTSLFVQTEPFNGMHGSGLGVEISSGTYVFDYYHPKELKDVNISEDGVDLIYIQRSKIEYTTCSPQGSIFVNNTDLVTKEVYRIVDGKLTHIKTVTGKIIPPTLVETYEFPE